MNILITVGVIILSLFIIALVADLIDHIEAKTDNIKANTMRLMCDNIWDKIYKIIDVTADSYTTDPRYSKLETHVVYDNIKSVVMDQIPEKDKAFLKEWYNPMFEYYISLIILSKLQDGYNNKRCPITFFGPDFFNSYFNNDDDCDEDE